MAFRSVSDGAEIAAGSRLEFDLCIVGAGAAGLAIAQSFIGRREKVVVLEGGGLQPDHDSQMLYNGDIAGLSMPKLSASRGRFLGGSTNAWNGYCRPLDALDFEERDWVQDSGWPIARDSLNPYIAEAHLLLGIENASYDTEEWSNRLSQSKLSFLPLESRDVLNCIEQSCEPSFLKTNLLSKIDQAPNISIISNVNVNILKTDPDARRVTSIEACCRNGAPITIAAQEFVLATGGIENPRLLLLSPGASGRGLGNEYDLVGRYFMDHPRVRSAKITLTNQSRHRRLYDHSSMQWHRRMNGPHRIFTHLSPSADVQRSQKIPNARTYFVGTFIGSDTGAFAASRRLRSMQIQHRQFNIKWSELIAGERFSRKALHGLGRAALGVVDRRLDLEWIKRDLMLETTMEQLPNRDSRVTLSDRRDRFGFRLPRVDWQMLPSEKATFIRYHNLLVSELTQKALIAPSKQQFQDEVWPDKIMTCWHHMGTTRMSRDPKDGVVDENCRMHGISNLHIAGSSTFPTGGADPPTLTILALALRLASRLKSQMTDR